MNFEEVKKMCNEHDSYLEKVEVIQYAKKERIWLKIVDARGNGFYLSEDEIKVLNEWISNKGLDIENKIKELLDYK